ncbi:hypothetical protein YA0002_16845 [Pseudomonas cichorii]|uniref:hypothetical protein n=1 Tax=Pseudomonas cichorii TaxID=36746 RepID=UPI0018E5D122|nr:hypothetical protein [Pseudomonas cichorii]MBI6854445.1 hypothetical protein [Pseudomonas cichorii]
MKMDFKKLSGILGALLLINLLAICTSEAQEKRPLFLYVFLHDDIPAAERTNLKKDYFSWMIKDLESFTGRRVYLDIIDKKSELSSFRYQTDDLKRGQNEWIRLVNRHLQANNLPLNGTTKYLLLTRYAINETTLGYTSDKHHTAIASLKTYTAAAHEIGHMLGGSHENSEVLFRGGWWCETNITPTREQIRTNCYVYSDKNKKIIAEHLNQFP